MTVSKIKTLMDRRTPGFMDEVFTQQIDRINEKIDELGRAQKLLFTLRKSIHSVENVNEDAITIQFLLAEAIVLDALNDYSQSKDSYGVLISFYNAISKKWPNLDLNYPVWGVFSEDRIKKGGLGLAGSLLFLQSRRA